MADKTPWHSEESTERYDCLFPILPDYVAHYTLGGKLAPKIGITKHSLELASKITSVQIADRLGISVAWAEKRYSPEESKTRWLGLTDQIDTLFEHGRSRLGYYVSFGLDLPKREETYEDLYMQFFFRNVAAFDASKRLSELGYLCEVAAILRSALEQFSFCARLWKLSGSEKLEAIRPVHSLGALKEIVPAAGQLYGLLSKYIHFEYDHHTHFFERSKTEVFTIQRGSVLRAYATHLLLLTMACVSVYVLRVSPAQFQEVPASVKELATFLEMVDKYSDKVCTIFSRDVVLAKLDILLRDLVTT
jgi:hypothetical protein